MDARPSISRTETSLGDEPTSPDYSRKTRRNWKSWICSWLHTTTGVKILMVTHSSQPVPSRSRVVEMAGCTRLESERVHAPST